MNITMQTIITSTIDVETLDVTHDVTVEAGEASALGKKGVIAIAIGGTKSALAALEAQDSEGGSQ